jgi:hypothetical protein
MSSNPSVDSAVAVVDPAPLVSAPSGDLVSTIERLALDPRVDVEKLERLIAMQERVLTRNAEAAFNSAFADMQAELPEIDERGAIKNKDGGVQSHYAKNEDIQKVLRPILKRFGFSLSFETQWPDKTMVRLIGILTHRDGHKRTSEFLAAADTSGSKNSIQALGSSISYGHRYTTCDLLNITSREPGHRDDDGDSAEKHRLPAMPEGLDDWLTRLETVAEKGSAVLESAWSNAPESYRKYVGSHLARQYAALRQKAARVR